MRTKTFFSSVLLLCSFFCFSAAAQVPAKIEAYKAGESLVYEAKFSKALLRGIEVAVVNFTVEKSPGSRNFLVKSEAKSKGTLSGIVLRDFLQNYESTVDGENFSILKTVKLDRQGDRVRQSEAVFHYKTKRVIYTETDPDEAARPPLLVASAIENGTQDLVSSIYALRRLPLAVGKSFELKISDSGLIYTIPVHVTKRELQKSVSGKTWCFRVEPEVFGKNRLIEKDGTMIIWITDDARRLPVRAQINTDLGRIEVKLKRDK
ncbi:MAG: DUF3108 domain-containing protein [Acidobacteriota bacterium]|jgi:hypothetical protein|nr:DUF3108 domain-containing protein [Acidobacteriota bacterium]